MTRTFLAAVGLTLLVLAPVRTVAQVEGSLDEVVRAGRFTFTPFTQEEAVTRAGRLPYGDADCAADAIGRYPKARVSEPSSKDSAITDRCRAGDAARTGFRKSDQPRVAARGSARAAALRRAVREQAPSTAGTRSLQRSLQGGLIGLGVGDGLWAGGFFGPGVAASPLPNLALFGDGHLVGGSGAAGLYGSGTIAYRGIIPDSSAEEIVGVGGVGLGLFIAGDYVAAGPQFVFGLEHKAGFGQIRVLLLPDGNGAFLLLGGVRF